MQTGWTVSTVLRTTLQSLFDYVRLTPVYRNSGYVRRRPLRVPPAFHGNYPRTRQRHARGDGDEERCPVLRAQFRRGAFQSWSWSYQSSASTWTD